MEDFYAEDNEDYSIYNQKSQAQILNEEWQEELGKDRAKEAEEEKRYKELVSEK